MILVDVSTTWLLPFFMLLARVGGLMVFVPFLSSAIIAPAVRVAFSVALSLILFPLVQNQIPAVSGDGPGIVIAMAGELLIGLLFGFIGILMIEGLQLAGHVIGFQMGFGVINVIDPQTQVETPVISILQNSIGLLVFLSINAHHWFIEALLESYRVVPQIVLSRTALFGDLVQGASQIFVLGIKLSAPVLVVLLVVDLIMGIVGRAAPQIHILVVGMPVKSLVGLVVFLLTIPSSVAFVFQEIHRLQGQIARILTLLAN